MQYSRLIRRSDRLTARQSYLLLAGSVVLLVLFIVFGFPAILNLAGAINGLRNSDNSSAVEKSIAPTTPTFSRDLEATKSAQITVAGVADPKISVEIFENGNSQGATMTDEAGKFSFDATLAKGVNVFTAQSVTSGGTKSQVSAEYQITFANSNPKLEISSPKDGDQLKDSPTTIAGISEPGVSVSVNNYLAIVKDDGSFSYSLGLNNGDNKVSVVATDKAGNQTKKELTVKYQP